ncbi:MAG: hypothetical protein MHM6MM_001569 [Cercozoa sp. M6MM]
MKLVIASLVALAVAEKSCPFDAGLSSYQKWSAQHFEDASKKESESDSCTKNARTAARDISPLDRAMVDKVLTHKHLNTPEMTDFLRHLPKLHQPALSAMSDIPAEKQGAFVDDLGAQGSKVKALRFAGLVTQWKLPAYVEGITSEDESVGTYSFTELKEQFGGLSTTLMHSSTVHEKVLRLEAAGSGDVKAHKKAIGELVLTAEEGSLDETVAAVAKCWKKGSNAGCSADGEKASSAASVVTSGALAVAAAAAAILH